MSTAEIATFVIDALPRSLNFLKHDLQKRMLENDFSLMSLFRTLELAAVNDRGNDGSQKDSSVQNMIGRNGNNQQKVTPKYPKSAAKNSKIKQEVNQLEVADNVPEVPE